MLYFFSCFAFYELLLSVFSPKGNSSVRSHSKPFPHKSSVLVPFSFWGHLMWNSRSTCLPLNCVLRRFAALQLNGTFLHHHPANSHSISLVLPPRFLDPMFSLLPYLIDICVLLRSWIPFQLLTLCNLFLSKNSWDVSFHLMSWHCSMVFFDVSLFLFITPDTQWNFSFGDLCSSPLGKFIELFIY